MDSLKRVQIGLMGILLREHSKLTSRTNFLAQKVLHVETSGVHFRTLLFSFISMIYLRLWNMIFSYMLMILALYTKTRSYLQSKTFWIETFQIYDCFVDDKLSIQFVENQHKSIFFANKIKIKSTGNLNIRYDDVKI